MSGSGTTVALSVARTKLAYLLELPVGKAPDQKPYGSEKMTMSTTSRLLGSVPSVEDRRSVVRNKLAYRLELPVGKAPEQKFYECEKMTVEIELTWLPVELQ